MTISFRPAAGRDSEDRRFIVSTWSSTYKASHYAGILWSDDYADIMHPQIERVLDRPQVTAIIACDRKDPAFFFGHIVGEVDEGETPIVHYVYTKAPYRNRGIARQLFEALGVNPWGYFVYSCKTEMISDRTREIGFDLRDKCPRGRFDPNGIRYSKANRRRAL